MRGKDLLECMEHIDDTLIEEALNPVIVPRWNTNIAVRWGMAAACVIVIGISAASLWSDRNIKEHSGGMDNDIAFQIAADSAAENTDNGAAALNGTSRTVGALAGSSQADGMPKPDMDTGRAYADDIAAAEESALLFQENNGIPDLAEENQESNGISDLAGEKAASQESAKAGYTVISGYSGNDSGTYCYKTPEKGKSFCFQHLQDAAAYYGGLEKESGSGSPLYAYAVVIDVFGDVETSDGIHYEQLNQTDDGCERIEQEYRRLIELGYSVRLSEDFQLTGTFTKEELDNFDASPEYGYAFRFENEG